MADYVITTAVGTGAKGFAGDGGPATAALLNGPFDVAFDRAGNLYFSDTFNHRIRRVDARSGGITTVAGNGEPGYSGDGGPAMRASLNEPYGIAIDRAGNIFVADRLNRRVRRIDAVNGTITTLAGTGIINTVAGTTGRGYSGDGGPALAAVFDAPKEMALDPDGNVLIVDTENHAIRLIDRNTGIVTTIAGGRQGARGDGGPAAGAGLDRPHGVVVGPDGAIYIGDTNNHRIRKLVRQVSSAPE